MNNIILLFVCLLLGMGLRTTRRLPENAHVALNAFIINISLPALIILQIHHVALQTQLLFSIAMPWLMFALGVGFFWTLRDPALLPSGVAPPRPAPMRVSNRAAPSHVPVAYHFCWPRRA